MAKDLELTYKKAQRYLETQGLTVSTQQVRNLARTNDIIMQGVHDYTDPVSEETHKVVFQSALDKYIKWRTENPESVGRAGRTAREDKRYYGNFTSAQLEQANQLLSNAGLPTLAIPVRKPRKSKNVDGIAPERNNGMTEPSNNTFSNPDVGDLELIEVS